MRTPIWLIALLVCVAPVRAEQLGLLGVDSLHTAAVTVAASPLTTGDRAGDAPAVVLVDGINGFDKGLFPTTTRDVNYLSKAEIGGRLRALTPEHSVQEIVWQGTYLIHPGNKLQTIERVRALIENACAKTRNVTVIGHSEGAEIGFLAISQLHTARVKNFISMGSYLKFTSLWHPRRKLTPEFLKLTGVWLNIHSEGDFAGGSLSAPVIDVRLVGPAEGVAMVKPTDMRFEACHRWPYMEPASKNLIERVVRGEVPDGATVSAHYAAAGTTINRPFVERIGQNVSDTFRFAGDLASGMFNSARSWVGL